MSKFASEIAEGTHKRHGMARAMYNSHQSNIVNLPPIFRRYVVHEVLFSPTLINEESTFDLVSKYGDIDNIWMFSQRVLPRNSIIAQEILNSSRSNTTEASRLMILFPLLAHIGVPCKAGEHVWVMFESITDSIDMGYWLSRIVGLDHIDDVNHSHAPREWDEQFVYNPLTDVVPKYHFKNGVFRNYRDPENDSLTPVLDPTSSKVMVSDDRDYSVAYENILSGSNAAINSIYEPVPRYKKRPGDLSLEGSNNSLIVLGRESAGYDPANTQTPIISSVSTPPTFRASAGSIDMVVGRGTTSPSLGNIVTNELGFSEINKLSNNLLPSEGDPDYVEDRSRILLSQRTNPDAKFKLNSYNGVGKKVDVSDSVVGDAAVVIRTDKVRIIARSDIQLLVQGVQTTAADPSGNQVTRSNTDITKWASVTIKSDGNIVFTPSDTGYIKLGGEDADKGILCTALPVTTLNGGISGVPLRNSSGGQIGGSVSPTPQGNSAYKDPALGKFANKVLIK